jgi:hypothetical protein
MKLNHYVYGFVAYGREQLDSSILNEHNLTKPEGGPKHTLQCCRQHSQWHRQLLLQRRRQHSQWLCEVLLRACVVSDRSEPQVNLHAYNVFPHEHSGSQSRIALHY